MKKLLTYHQRLVAEKGLPPSRLMLENTGNNSLPEVSEFQCEICETISESQNDLNNHIKQKHKETASRLNNMMEILKDKEELLKGKDELIKLLKDTITDLDAEIEHKNKKIEKADRIFQNMQNNTQDTSKNGPARTVQLPPT